MKKIKNKNIITIIMLAVLILSSVLMQTTYSKIETVINNNELDRAISSYIAKESCYYNYIIDAQLKSEHYLDSRFQQYINPEGVTEEEIDSILGFLNAYKRNLNHNKDIKYYAIDNENRSTSNTNDKLANIQNDKKLQDQYRFYVQVTYDKDGTYNVNFMSKMKGYDAYRFKSEYEEFALTNSIYSVDNGTPIPEYKSLKNLTITYAVPNELSPTGEISSILTSSDSLYLLYALPYIVCFIALTMIITFFMPISVLNDNKFFKFIINIKFEILGWLWCFTIFCMSIISNYLIAATIQDIFTYIYTTIGIESFASVLTPTLNFLFWFIYFGLFMILAYCIKYLFHVGIKRYFMDHTCLGWFIKKFKQLMNYATQIDFNNNTNKTVLKIVVVNFIIISIISFFWTFGILFAVFYSIIIFIILKKKFDEIQDDYRVLLKATKELSNGHFDVHINQDVGVFNPLKDEFSHIKDGFEKAVNEEVKSQKMKTELISNVSHDLKTPLTSIITYIDLLKNTDLSEEEKQNYIQVIDRNSLRLKNLIDDLFEVSKANSGDIKLDLVDVDIVALIKQAQFECSDKFEEKQLDLRMNTNQEKIICHLDSFKTYRIFENLFMNISKYAMIHTRVYIDIIDNEENVTITFKNISESEMNFNENEIVERFVQGDKSRNTSGSGLGLAIVKSFAELQNGQLKIDIDGDLFKSTLIFKK